MLETLLKLLGVLTDAVRNRRQAERVAFQRIVVPLFDSMKPVYSSNYDHLAVPDLMHHLPERQSVGAVQILSDPSVARGTLARQQAG